MKPDFHFRILASLINLKSSCLYLCTSNLTNARKKWDFMGIYRTSRRNLQSKVNTALHIVFVEIFFLYADI